MARSSNFPILFDSCKRIDIAFLKKHGYLEDNVWKNGTITWSRNGREIGSAGLCVKMDAGHGELILSYTFNKTEVVKYTVQIVSQTSNLGKGYIYYFLCPTTHKQCRILYGAGKYFLHRDAVKGCYYDIQTQSRLNRKLINFFEIHKMEEEVYSEYCKPYFKSTYKGDETKKMKKLQAKLEFYNRVKHKIPSEEMLLLGLL